MQENLSAQIPSSGTGFGEGGAPAVTPFVDTLPEQYRSEAWAQDLSKKENPIHALAQDYHNARGLIGKKSAGLEVPGADATPEAVKAFHKALGAPENEAGYEYKPAIDLTKENEGIQKAMQEMAKDDRLMKSMKAVALNEGMTPKQFNAIASAFDQFTLDGIKSQQSVLAAAEETRLKAETESFDKLYGSDAEAVKRVGGDLAKKLVSEAARATGNPAIMLFDALNAVHKKFYANDTIANTNTSTPSGGASVEQLHAKIMELRNNPTVGAAYKDPFHTGHKAAKEQIDGLYEQYLTLKNNKE